jgi:hypothetical protein
LILPFHFLDYVPFLQEKYRLQLKSWNKTPTNNRAGFIHFGDEFSKKRTEEPFSEEEESMGVDLAG